MSDILPQNATSDDGLTPVQAKALAALLAGKTVTAAAKEANVDRTTVYRWLRDQYKPEFRMALAHGRQELRQAVEARLLAMADKAAGCLEVALTTGDAKAALALLKGLALLAGQQR